jgi:hypothetical protein
MKTIEQLRQSRVELTPTVYYKNYLTLADMPDNIVSVHVYFDAYTIEKIWSPEGEYNRLFMLTIGNDTYHFDDLMEAEQHLWDEFLVDELKPKPTLEEIQEEALEVLSIHVESVFTTLHGNFPTKSGDITPTQLGTLNELKKKLSLLIAEQVHSNL